MTLTARIGWIASLSLAVSVAVGAAGRSAGSAPGSPAASDKPADIEAGKKLYVQFCKKCHGEKGEGVPRMYALVDAKIVHLGSKEAQAKSDADIKKAMLEGFKKMEAVEDITPEQADKILAFERTLRQ